MASHYDIGICCRSCGYSLRGLELARCPECGQVFDRGDAHSFDCSQRSRRARLWRCRFARVGLAALGLFVTAGLGLGAIRYRWVTEQGGIRELRAIGGDVKVERVGPAVVLSSLPRSLVWAADRPVLVLLYGARASDSTMEHVGTFGRLRELYLVNTSVTAQGLRHIRTLYHLKVLCIRDAAIDNAALSHLRGLRDLEHLVLTGVAIDDDGARELIGLRKLRKIDLTHTRVSNETMTMLADMPCLTELTLDGTDISSAGLADIGRINALVELSLGELRIGADGMKHLQGLKNLQTLHLANAKITGNAFRALTQLPALSKLSMREAHFDQAFLCELSSCGGLRELWLDCTNVDDVALRDLPNVQYLSLAGNTRITDAGIEQLMAKHKTLQYLNITGTGVTAAAFERLSRRYPTIRVERGNPETTTARGADR